MQLHRFFQNYQNDDLPYLTAKDLAETHDCSLAEIEQTAIQQQIIPTRYIRNNLSCTQQLRLCTSRIAIIGCGGLGGMASAILARVGIGTMHLVDPDFFEEHNLNRQQFCTLATLGQAKAQVISKELEQLNPAIKCTYSVGTFTKDDITNMDLVIDGLDTPEGRIELSSLCEDADIPIIHGAVSNWFGQVGIANNANGLIKQLYKQNEQRKPATIKVLGSTVAQVASLQAAEAVKTLLTLPSQLENHWLNIDLLHSDFDLFSYSTDPGKS